MSTRATNVKLRTRDAVPARLHVILARKGKTGIVIRRGPSREVALIGWDRRTDEFQLGQWLRGRVYERRCDLSPDGRHFIYFAMNGRWKSASMGSWSAISRAPYFTALSFFPKGDCWHGGGLFTSDRTYWLNDGYGHIVKRDVSGLTRTPTPPGPEQYGGECPGVYFHRLQRDGWKLVSAEHGARGQIVIFEKPINSRWLLRKFANASLDHGVGQGVYFDTHELVDFKKSEIIDCPDWEWADLDGRRLLWAGKGKLNSGRIGKDGLFGTQVLYDFNGMVFEKREAPYA